MKNYSDCLEHLEAHYLSFWNGKDKRIKTYYKDHFALFCVTAEEFFTFLDGQEELTDEGFCILGDLYYHVLGTKGNDRLAFENYSRAAEDNYPPALYLLSFMYFSALGTKENKVQALSCISKAAARNFIPAIIELAKYYINGWGVPKDFEKALELLVKARNTDYRQANESISILVSELIKEGDTQEGSYSKNLQFLIKARDLGIDTKELINRFLKVIEKERTNEFALKCYTQASREGFGCQNDISRLEAKVAISREMALDMLRKDAVRELVYKEPNLFGITLKNPNQIELQQVRWESTNPSYTRS